MAGRLWYIIFTSRTPKESVSSGDEDITGEPREQPERYFYERLVKLTRTEVAASRRKGREINVPPMLGGSPPFFSLLLFLSFFSSPLQTGEQCFRSRHFASSNFPIFANRKSIHEFRFRFIRFSNDNERVSSSRDSFLFFDHTEG